jgi:hypothetical protein
LNRSVGGNLSNEKIIWVLILLISVSWYAVSEGQSDSASPTDNFNEMTPDEQIEYIEKMDDAEFFRFLMGMSEQENDRRERAGDQEYAIGSRGPVGGLLFYDKGGYADGWWYLEVAPYKTETQ